MDVLVGRSSELVQKQDVLAAGDPDDGLVFGAFELFCCHWGQEASGLFMGLARRNFDKLKAVCPCGLGGRSESLKDICWARFCAAF